MKLLRYQNKSACGFMLVFLCGVGVQAKEPYPLETSLGGVQSAYTDVLLTLAKNSSVPDFAEDSQAKHLSLRCFSTEGNDLYVGIGQYMRISAPFEQVERVLDAIDGYRDLFPGYEQIKVTSRDANRLVTFWEQKIPIFSNAKYEMNYLFDSSKKDQKIYRYQLREDSSLKVSDGFIRIERMKDGTTRYVEYDFFDAHWGAAQLLGKKKIWSDAIEGISISDIAIKLKAENPSWDSKKAKQESEKAFRRQDAEECFNSMKPLKTPSP